MKRKLILMIGLFALAFFVQAQIIVTPEKFIKRTFRDAEGKEIQEIIVPGKPPEFRMPEAVPVRSAVVLPNVPAYDWSFGCSATSASMMAGYYDRTGFSNIYAGPANGGVAPMDNSVWGTVIINGEVRSQCPLSATRNGVDGRTIKGHVDDFWVQVNSTSPDPYIGHWTMHDYGECTGDYMGTNQSALGSIDGSTTFYYYTDGSPLVNYNAGAGNRDGCFGMRQFFESRSYPVVTNYTQLIYGYNGNNLGFTFAQYMQEIDAGRPVLIQVSGHTMLGYGYDAASSLVYLRDTWDYLSHTMVWGSSYAGLQQWGVTAIQLQSATPAIAVTPGSFNQELYSQGMATQTLNIANYGNGTLDYSIALSYTYPAKAVKVNKSNAETQSSKGIVLPHDIKKSITNGNIDIPEFGRSTLYYNQTVNPTSIGYTSQEFSDMPTFSNTGADDFIVPAGATWNIRHVYAGGSFGYSGGTTVPLVNIIFFQDASGFPGTTFADFTAITPVCDASGNLNIYLPSTVTLTAGHYWVAIAANMAFGTYGQWYWLTQLPPTILNEFAWQNPGGGWGFCPSWCYGSAAFPGELNLNFTFALSDATWQPWLSATPLTGSVAAFSSVDIPVTFDATGLLNDTYTGQLTVNSNDPVNPSIALPGTLVVKSPGTLPLSENWSSGDLTANGWTLNPSQSNWQVSLSYGNLPPAVIFDWSPSVTNYECSLISKSIDATGITDNITLQFDLLLDNYSTATLEGLAVDVWGGGAWHTIHNFTNAGGGFAWTSQSFDITSSAASNYFNIRFRAYGENSFNINRWIIDNIKVYRQVLGLNPASLTVTVPKGEATTRSIAFLNNGNLPLYWHSNVESNIVTVPGPVKVIGISTEKKTIFSEFIQSNGSLSPGVPGQNSEPSVNQGGINTSAILSSTPLVNKFVPDFSRATVYYNQTGYPSMEGTAVSQTFPDYPGYTSKSADDFTVPTGASWNIRHIFCNGIYFNGGYEMPAVDVIFYANNSGSPGAIISAFNNIPANSDISGNLDIFLPSPVNLTAGHYWMSVAAVMDFTTHGEWGWSKQLAPVILDQFVWQNPQNGFGLGCGTPTWCPGTMVASGVDNNLGFALSNSTQMITLNPNQGPLSANSSQNVNVIFNAALLDVGQYTATINFDGGANVFPVSMPVIVNVVLVPSNFDVPNTTISTGQSFCYDALQTLTVGGTGKNFIVLPGGNANLITGQNIRIMPGARVYSSGYLWGHITTNNQFCGAKMSPELPESPEKAMEFPAESATSLFKVYPNPTMGTFTLKIDGQTSTDRYFIKIYSMMGELVLKDDLTGTTEKVLSLQSKAEGIYLIYVTVGDRTETTKLIRRH
ncbi:MAG: T9SS type A sorting domain-containing protein [Bacteroidota bacterium]